MRVDAAQLDKIEETLVKEIRGFVRKFGYSRVNLGLSGGLDSALVAYLAAMAVGADNVICISMPSRFSSPGSVDDALELAANLGCRCETFHIEQIYAAFLSVLEPAFEYLPFDVTEENIQARIRGTLLMAYSNKFNSMVLSTGNKSEIAMGYCTIYGDTVGALSPIGDLFKTEVFALSKRINERSAMAGGKEIIPHSIIGKPPSAELRPNQKDEDSLPPYNILDRVLWLHLHDKLSGEEIIEKEGDREMVDRILKTIAGMEFKRRQMPPVIEL